MVTVRIPTVFGNWCLHKKIKTHQNFRLTTVCETDQGTSQQMQRWQVHIGQMPWELVAVPVPRLPGCLLTVLSIITMNVNDFVSSVWGGRTHVAVLWKHLHQLYVNSCKQANMFHICIVLSVAAFFGHSVWYLATTSVIKPLWAQLCNCSFSQFVCCTVLSLCSLAVSVNFRRFFA